MTILTRCRWPFAAALILLAGVSLLLVPKSALDNEYMVLGWPQTIADTDDPATDFHRNLRAFLTVVGLEEGLFPLARAMETREELEEERRLFYVGVTRAENRLYLSHTFRRTMFGSSDLGEPSRFLADIPSRLKRDGDPLKLCGSVEQLT